MKKGFTLIEILAVIIILAIVLTLVSTNVLNIISSSREKTYNEQLNSLKKLSQQYATEFYNDLTWSSNQTTITLDQLINAGYLEENIINAKTGESICSTSTIEITDTNGVYTYEITIYNGATGC